MLIIQLKKTDYSKKITGIENKLKIHNYNKYIDNAEFNKLAVDVFNTRIAQANLITKTDFHAKLSSLSKNITQYKTKHLLVESELKKLKTFYSGYFIRKSHFEEDGAQMNLFQNGNLKDCLMKVLRQFLPLIIVLIQH